MSTVSRATKYKIQPAPGRVAVRQLGHAEMTEGGIHIPATLQEKPTQGVVIATCPEYEQDGEMFPPMYGIGDVVVFGRYTGTQLQVGRDHVIVLRENDILCKLVEAQDHEGTDDDLIGAAAPLTKIKVNDRA